MLAQQQRYERPPEALGQKMPASLYEPSPRPYSDRIDDPSYGSDVAVRRVRSTGQIKWAGDLLFVGEALIGEPVGVVETEDGDCRGKGRRFPRCRGVVRAGLLGRAWDSRARRAGFCCQGAEIRD